jgi:hypothetical protein
MMVSGIRAFLGRLPLTMEALAPWLRESDGFYANHGREVPDGWHVMADALQASTIYE